MMFGIDPRLEELRHQVRDFVDRRVLPVESQIVNEDGRGLSATLASLQREAKQAGLWTPHLPESLGGLGLGVTGMCALFREMGRSLVAPRVFNCDAPDQGNMDLLLRAASPSIREKYLARLASAEITSAFCMTEPAPGAGADHRNLRTTATRDGDGWIIDGHKWFSTGAGRASFLIVMAKTSDDKKTGASMFVVDRHAEGIEHLRDVPVMAPDLLAHREAELRFSRVRVGNEAVLGAIGDGFRLAQARLVPARLTHCMRWLGLADRALSLCRDYLARRESFGRTLGEHQAIQAMLAKSASAIHAGNLMTWHCALLIESGADKEALPYSSMCKLHVARLLCQVLDDAIQMHGGLGYSHDMPFARWYQSARAARIADGPDEVHQMVIAKAFLGGKLELLV